MSTRRSRRSNTQLDAAFVDRLADPTIAAPGATVFPETRLLGPSTPTVDPGHARRPGDRVVRPRAHGDRDRDGRRRGAASRRVAEERLKASDRRRPPPRRRTRSRSTSIRPSSPAAGSASRHRLRTQTAVLDADELKRQVHGEVSRRGPRRSSRPTATSTLSAWPDWVVDRADVRRPGRPDGERRGRDRVRHPPVPASP